MLPDYEKQVYAALLGKVIGVYLGRPVEGWSKADIAAKVGLVDRYVADELKVPLVVSDDDISGTLTFVRALEDSGLYADTPPEFFGKTWLNYLIENKTILWWGGMSLSTEHTAYLRLKQGFSAPESGSIALNGKAVAEQIGAQIFIEGFGLAAPGNPELAARLARMAGEVSHDGEAVHAAVVVAVMTSLAFVEKSIEKLLDRAMDFIPPDSLIARVHRDVRQWAREDGDWNKTFERIDEHYGYRLYGGNCHVIPNHAAMVMAWSYAGDDFFESQKIINSIGWDTDCNAANVGCVVALAVGLAHLTDRYDFRTPFADRIVIPSAEGTYSVSDVWTEARKLARVGRKIAGETVPAAGSWHDFAQPGAVHGYQSAALRLANPDGRGLRVSAAATGEFETPVSYAPGSTGGYHFLGTPRLVSGYRMKAEFAGKGKIGMFIATATRNFRSSAIDAAAGQMEWRLPDTGAEPIRSFGFFAGAGTELTLTKVDFTPEFSLDFGATLPGEGWINDLDVIRGEFSDDPAPIAHLGKNRGVGVAVTGTLDWRDYRLACDFKIHAADRAGVVVRYQGLCRYYAVAITRSELQIIRNHYGETVLASIPFAAENDRRYPLEVAVSGAEITVRLEGREVLRAADGAFASGGAGFMVENGLAGYAALKIRSITNP